MNSAGKKAEPVSYDILADCSLEITGKDVPELDTARALLPAGTRINVTYLANENLELRRGAALAAKRTGFTPVPHIAARRLPDEHALVEFLSALRADGTAESLFVIGGDPARPEGPYPDTLTIIESGLLEQHGVRQVGIAGYPEAHPAIPTGELWAALEKKAAALTEHNLSGEVITQFGFDVDAVIDWIEQTRARDVTLPIRVGVPGPAGVRRLLTMASRLGVGSSATIAKKYGLSVTNLLGTAGPERFIRELAERIDPANHGRVGLHFYTFGGLRTTAEWIDGFLARV
ncbi:methylenetetrahydrofolate reductase [Nocardia sp. NPDC050630]|uniref:methylenetetrahydrofolate reductase n=1 Tax=Nocardia sp. NPDC050630 TaxID=3364321 RepID=UPI0037A6B9A5